MPLQNQKTKIIHAFLTLENKKKNKVKMKNTFVVSI